MDGWTAEKYVRTYAYVKDPESRCVQTAAGRQFDLIMDVLTLRYR